MSRLPLPSALVTVARPDRMWQYSPAADLSAVKRPGVHSQTPILVRPSGEVHSTLDASVWPSVRDVGLSAKAPSGTEARSAKVCRSIMVGLSGCRGARQDAFSLSVALALSAARIAAPAPSCPWSPGS